MLPNADAWLYGHWRWRLLSICALALTLYGAGEVLKNVTWRTLRASVLQQKELERQLYIQRQYLQKISPVADMKTQLLTPALPVPVPSFSALHFSQQTHSHLVNWQPGAEVSTLVLEVNWPALPSLLTQLSEQPVDFHGFSLVAREQVLTFTLFLGGMK